jgi:hypothetical protein
MLKTQEDFAVAALLRNFESVEQGQLIIELADSGEKKGNYVFRLESILKAFEEHQHRLEKQKIHEIEDETEALKQYYAKLSKVNIRTTGIN